MKKMPYLLAFLLVFLVLTACNGDAVEDASVENVTASHTMLPEKKRLDPVSAPALITEGRIPSENYDLPTTCISLHEWEAFGDYPLALLAELPEADAAFYSLDWDKVLIRWEDSLAEFDWLFATPRSIPPQIWCSDLDGDGQDELAIDCYIGSGTGVSIEELHILEKTPDGSLTAYTFPETLWREQIPPLMEIVSVEDWTFVVMGVDLVNVYLEDDVPREALEQPLESGEAATFERLGGGTCDYYFRLHSSVCLNRESRGGLQYVTDYDADIDYKDGVFQLSNFHLQ